MMYYALLAYVRPIIEILGNEMKKLLVLSAEIKNMSQRKPRDPLTEYRNRAMREKGTRGQQRSPSPPKSSERFAKAIVIVFVIIILIVIYVIGFMTP
jgi:hypothetical protein